MGNDKPDYTDFTVGVIGAGTNVSHSRINAGAAVPQSVETLIHISNPEMMFRTLQEHIDFGWRALFSAYRRPPIRSALLFKK